MDLYVYSIYDKVSKQSIFITMHNTSAEAEREFKRAVLNSSLKDKKNDLELVLIGEFNTVTLDLDGLSEPLHVLCGSDVTPESEAL